jgi:hypothetical protein
MKTQIIHLEPHDDVISARDKMDWGQTGRILLVWPERGSVLTRRLDLVLLKRHSAFLGAQLAIMTSDADVLFHARRLAIPVFKNLRQAQRSHWRVERRFRSRTYRRKMEALKEPYEEEIPEQEEPDSSEDEPPRARHEKISRPETIKRPLPPVARLTFFALGVLALLSIAAVLLPGADLALTPQSRTQEISIDVKADPDIQSVYISGLVPSRNTSVIVEGRDHLTASGSTMIPVQPAQGNILFTNLTDTDVRIPSGTIVRTLDRDIRFETLKTGTVTAGSGLTVTLPIRALEPGVIGNLPKDSLVALEGILGTQLTVTNPRATSGGKDLRSPAPSQSDRNQLKARLLEALRKEALDEVKSGLPAGDVLLPGTLTLGQTLEETFEPAETQPADQLDLSMRLEFTVQVVSNKDLRELAESALNANLSKDFSPWPDTLQIKNTAISADSATPTEWKMIASRRIMAKLPETEAVKLALGLSPVQAKDRLASALPLGAPPKILLTPAWWPRMPILPFRIGVELVQNP